MSTLRCLWVTRLFPYPPFIGGDAIYSSHLIEQLSSVGAQVTVLTHKGSGLVPPDAHGVAWELVARKNRGRALSLIGRVPALVHRSSTPEIRERFVRLVTSRPWDAVLLDNLAMLGLIDLALALRDRGHYVVLTYVSHNHEESLRRQLADLAPRWDLRRIALMVDARKAAVLERTAVNAVDLVTTTTLQDADLHRRLAPDQDFLVLSPGYDGPKLRSRTIREDTPRRVLFLGSFAAFIKQLNLVRFLRAAVRPLSRAGIGLDVVGTMPNTLRTRLRSEFPFANIAGTVADVSPFLKTARVGVVAEEIGGGFKLKVLDYVFNRVPVAALAGSVAGTPLVPNESILEYSTVAGLVHGLVQVVDDVETLNSLHEAAYRACEGHFDWADRGRLFAAELIRLRSVQ